MIEYNIIALIAILGAMSPGPDLAIVTKNLLVFDKRAAVLTSIGIGLGLLVHTTYCVLGLALVISQSLWLFALIKYMGAAYLIYLGLKGLLTPAHSHLNDESPVSSQHNHMSDSAALRNGFLTNVLNPKCTMFMLSIFTFLIKPNTPIMVQISYGLEIAIITGGWFILVSLILGHRKIQRHFNKIKNKITKIMGVVLIILGCIIVFEQPHKPKIEHQGHMRPSAASANHLNDNQK